MLLAAMLAMVLVAASPAFAQATGGNISVQTVNCPQGQSASVTQSGAAAGGASVGQSAGVSQSQVNGCVGGVHVSSAPSTSSVMSSSSAASSATTVVMPETGGGSLIALGAGVLLVGGGLLARRVIRQE